MIVSSKKNTVRVSLCLISILLISRISTNMVEASALELQQMLLKIEEDTAAFAHHMEDLILNKCNFTSDDTCYKASYHTCDSEFPSAMCPGNEYSIKQCGSQGSGCGGLIDFSTSVVSVAPSNNPFGGSITETINDRVRDGVCSTLRLERDR